MIVICPNIVIVKGCAHKANETSDVVLELTGSWRLYWQNLYSLHPRPSIPITPKDPCPVHRPNRVRATFLGLQSLDYTRDAFAQFGHHLSGHLNTLWNYERVSR